MKTNFLSATLMLSFIAIGFAGFSQTRTPVIRERQINQQKRIADGVKDGELTARETRNLERREAKIRHDKKEAKSDGRVTRRERRKLQKEQKRTSRAIARQKHDRQKRH